MSDDEDERTDVTRPSTYENSIVSELRLYNIRLPPECFAETRCKLEERCFVVELSKTNPVCTPLAKLISSVTPATVYVILVTEMAVSGPQTVEVNLRGCQQSEKLAKIPFIWNAQGDYRFVYDAIPGKSSEIKTPRIWLKPYVVGKYGALAKNILSRKTDSKMSIEDFISVGVYQQKNDCLVMKDSAIGTFIRLTEKVNGVSVNEKVDSYLCSADAAAEFKRSLTDILSATVAKFDDLREFKIVTSSEGDKYTFYAKIKIMFQPLKSV